MKRNSISDNWTYFQTSNTLLSKVKFRNYRKLSFLKKISRLHSSLKVVENKITSVIGENEQQINVDTISLIAFNYSKLLKTTLPKEKQTVIIGHDVDQNSFYFSSILSHSLAQYGIKVFNFPQNHDTPLAISKFALAVNKADNLIYIRKNNSISESFSFIFKNKDNTMFTQKDLEILNSRIQPKELNDKSILETNSYNKNNIEYFDEDIFDDYVKYIISENKINKKNDFSVSILSLSKSQEEFIKQPLRRLNYKFFDNTFNVEKIKKDSWKDLIKQKKILKALSKSIKKDKSDLGFVFSTDSSEMACLVKHKMLVKYLDYTSLALLYINYLKETNSKNIVFYRLKSTTSFIDSFVTKIPNSKVVVCENREEVLNKASTKNNFSIFIDEENKFFVCNKKPLSGFDTLTFATKILEMAEYYKDNGMNLYEAFIQFENENGVVRESVEAEPINREEALNLIKRISKLKKFNNQKIVEKYKLTFEENHKNLILKLEDSTEILIKYNNYKNELKYFVRTPILKQNFSETVIIEKTIINEINKYKEINENNPNNFKKNVVKYTLSVIFLFIVFYLMFNVLYKEKDSQNPLSIFEDSWKIFSFSYLTRLKFILLTIVSIAFYQILHAITIWWMMKKQGSKVKIRHLIVASFIGIFVSNITPLYIGGDLISYWYLRRKKYDTSKLVATFLASSFIFQITLVVNSLVMMPLMFTLYKDFFQKWTSESYAITFGLIIGIGINTLGVLLYWTISTWKWLQVKIIAMWTFVMEALPFIFVIDPRKISGTKYYAFDKTRSNFKDLTKSPFIFCVVFIIKLLSSFLTFSPFIAELTGLLKPNLPWGSYIYILIGSNIIRSANSISITPGGVGTGDFISLQVFQLIFYNTSHLHSKGIFLTSQSGVQIFSFLGQFIFYMVPTVLSGLLLLTVWLGEKRIQKYEKIKINYNLQNEKTVTLVKTKTNIFKIMTVIWVIGIKALLLLLMLI